MAVFPEEEERAEEYRLAASRRAASLDARERALAGSQEALQELHEAWEPLMLAIQEGYEHGQESEPGAE